MYIILVIKNSLVYLGIKRIHKYETSLLLMMCVMIALLVFECH